MKKLFIILAVFLASCSVHKNISSSHVKTDSAISTAKDSSFVSRDTAHYSDFEAKGVDVEIDYSNGSIQRIDSASEQVNGSASDPIQSIIKDALSNSGRTGRIPTAIKIHVDSLSQKSGSNAKVDSGYVSQVVQAHVKTDAQTSTKVVTKTGGVPWWIYVIGGLVFLGFAAIKLFKITLPFKI